MHWLVISWMVTGGLVPLQLDGIVTGANAVVVQGLPNADFVTLGLEARILNHIVLSGSMETYMVPDGNGLFGPNRIDYTAGAAFTWGPFELGFRHECDHGVESYSEVVPWYASSQTQLYLTFRGSTSF